MAYYPKLSVLVYDYFGSIFQFFLQMRPGPTSLVISYFCIFLLCKIPNIDVPVSDPPRVAGVSYPSR